MVGNYIDSYKKCNSAKKRQHCFEKTAKTAIPSITLITNIYNTYKTTTSMDYGV